MAKRAQKKYGPGGNYYRKRIRKPDGSYLDVYGRTTQELEEKVTLTKAALVAASEAPAAELYTYEYATRWYANRSPHLSPAMRKMVSHQINNVICPVIGGKPLASVTSDDIAAVMASRAHLSRSSQSKTVLVLRQLFEAAEDAGAIERSPVRRLKAGGKTPAKKKALTQTQQDSLIAAVRGLTVEPCVMLGLFTGMRREEICGLKWDCVQLTGRAPHIAVYRACRWPENNQPEITDALKSGAASRTIPIPPVLTAYLTELRAAQLAALQKRLNKLRPAAKTQQPPLQNRSENKQPAADPQQAELLLRSLCVYGTETGAPISMTTFRRRWEAIRYRSTASGHPLGYKPRNHTHTVTLDFYPSPHILRHTYITRLILGGMDLKRVQYLAGHADPHVTLQIYTDLMGHLPEDLIQDITNIFTPPSS